MYDRTEFVTAAQQKGDRTPPDTARRLKVAPNTAWRLWHGRTAPSAGLIAAVQEHYGITPAQLLRRKVAA
ncbi:XRE family transcriptional regulator [Streptomyces sp. NPDC048330]|uniref:XRE family transcriptional regulator n=1 Tax=Streptomyces sp. NPDC048330 TaxID=3365533 RepID=UPI00371E22D0